MKLRAGTAVEGLGVNETQESSLVLVFYFAYKAGLVLPDLKDRRAVISHLTSDEGRADLEQLGACRDDPQAPRHPPPLSVPNVRSPGQGHAGAERTQERRHRARAVTCGTSVCFERDHPRCALLGTRRKHVSHL
jgi:hypothetical protein